jgi:hypothetical protein
MVGCVAGAAYRPAVRAIPLPHMRFLPAILSYASDYYKQGCPGSREVIIAAGMLSFRYPAATVSVWALLSCNRSRNARRSVSKIVISPALVFRVGSRPLAISASRSGLLIPRIRHESLTLYIHLIIFLFRPKSKSTLHNNAPKPACFSHRSWIDLRDRPIVSATCCPRRTCCRRHAQDRSGDISRPGRPWYNGVRCRREIAWRALMD